MQDGNVQFAGRADTQVKLKGFRIELGEIEFVLTQHPSVREAIVVAREEEAGDKRLVAYIVPAVQASAAGETSTGSGIAESVGNTSEWQRWLKERLPQHMIPASFVVLERLPLMPNGKVNRGALPAPDGIRAELEGNYVAPQTPVEETLARIWADFLRLDRVGIHDNLFELGADSMLSLRATARANQAGIHLTPRQIFQHQTIARLAAAAAGTSHLSQAEQGEVTGIVPLTPVQRRFFEQELIEPSHWNQSVMLEVHEPLDEALLKQAIGHLLRFHDALRLRFSRSESGWQQVNSPVDEDVPFSRFDFSATPDAGQPALIDEAANKLQASLNLTKGPLMRVVLFDLGKHKPARLLLIVHHLAVDIHSWRILIEDLELTYRRLSHGETASLGAKTTSFKRWAERLNEYAQSPKLKEQLSYWRAQLEDSNERLPLDYAGGANTVGSEQSVSATLDSDETYALLQAISDANDTQIDEVLLSALAYALSQWVGTGGAMLVDLESDGREELFEDVGVVRTVGWFNAIFPVSLTLDKRATPESVLKSMKERLRDIPDHGIGFGLLNYFCEAPEIVEQLQKLPRAEVSFNYLGQFNQMLYDSTRFNLSSEPAGHARGLKDNRPYLIEISSRVMEGQLTLTLTYSENIHRRETIEALARKSMEMLRQIINAGSSFDLDGYAPASLHPKFDGHKLDRVLATVEFE
jgi:non-ribosomal peptide synthase protein (TIGR01720 family)